MRSRHPSSTDPLASMRALETWQIRVRQGAAVHVHPAVLGAACQRRDEFARVEQPLRVERFLHREERCALARRELHAHGVELLQTDAVLAGNGSAERYAQLED